MEYDKCHIQVNNTEKPNIKNLPQMERLCSHGDISSISLFAEPPKFPHSNKFSSEK